MAAAAVERGSTERLQFLDAVRGFALMLMIVNHTGRWWQDGAMGWPRYNLIYTSMAIGAPLFLFLVPERVESLCCRRFGKDLA